MQQSSLVFQVCSITKSFKFQYDSQYNLISLFLLQCVFKNTEKQGKVNDEQLDLNANSENNLNNDDDINSLKNIVEEMTEVENKEEKSKKSFK